MRPILTTYGLVFGLALSGTLPTSGSTFAADRITQLRAEATEALQAKDPADQARAAELRAFAEALDPVQDAYFEDAQRPKAIELRNACAAIDHAACTDLALMYDRGRGTWQDQALARSIYLVSCEEGHLPACEQYTLNEGSMIYLYRGPNPTIPHFTNGCAAKNAEHCHRLAFQHPDRGALEALLDRACDLGYLESCSLRNNWDRYIMAARDHCKAGDGEGCAALAFVYRVGKHLNKDTEKEIEFIEQACKLGHARSCTSLGHRYESGKGVPSDPVKALAYYNLGCEARPYECWTLAYRYIKGEIVEKDLQRAMALAQRACNTDDALPAHRACQFVRGGNDKGNVHGRVPNHIQPYADAAKKACDQDNGNACYLLAYYYWRSEAGEQFRKAAVQELQDRSCRLGNQAGCTAIAGRGIQNPDLNMLNEACVAGEGRACAKLLRHDKSGDDQTRIARLENGCENGIGMLCRILGELLQDYRDTAKAYDIASPGIDYARALALFERGCDLGDGRSCYWMWLSVAPDGNYQPYSDISKDAAKALAFRERACTHGDTWQCEMLVYDLRGTEGRSADLQQARTYAEIGCQQGDCDPLEQVVLLEARAALTEQFGPLEAALIERYEDFNEPVRAHVRRARRSCKSGLLDGCIRLAEAYDNGDNDFWGLKQQLTHGPWVEALLLHACESGSAEGCYRYGDMFQYGYHNDDAIAAEYLGRACDMGYELACKN